MKKWLLLSLLLSIFGRTEGETARSIKVTFSEKDFMLTVANKVTHITTDKYFYSYGDTLSQPALPYVGVSVLIGPNEELVDYSYSMSERLLMSDVNMAASIEAMPTSIPVSAKRDTIATYKEESYPHTPVYYTGSYDVDDYKCISFNICPFRYDYSKKMLFIEDDVFLNLSLTTKAFSGNIKTRPSRLSIESIVVNPEDKLLYSDNQDKLLSQSQNSDDQFDYVIITNNNLKLAFQKLANWKTRKGVRTKVLSVEEIYATYSGTSQQIKIKKALIDLYNNNLNFKYALLAGDNDIVPSQMCLIKFNNYSDSCPTDLYYACFGTMDWDTNGNGVCGEIEDAVSIYPNIALTRAPVSTLAEAENFVNRIVSYESIPNVGNWSNNILMCGCQLGGTYEYDGIWKSDTQYKGEVFYNDYIANYWNGSKTFFYDTYTDLPGGANYDFIPANIQSELAKGYTFVNVDTHGLPESWITEGTSYTSSDAAALINSKYSLITTSACNTNAFDSPICLSEAFIRNPNSGITSYFGCSRLGWYYNNQYSIGPSSLVNSELYKQLFTDESKSFGEIVRNVRLSIRPQCNSYGNVYRWLLFGLNPIGDPEMPIYIYTPQQFSNLTLNYSNGVLNINTNITDCRICVASRNDNGNSYYKVINGSTASLSGLTDEYTICISKPGYVPYLAICGDTVYIQNEDINSNWQVYANHVLLGSDVTTDQTSGPVTIQGASVDIHTMSDVTIKNNFEVKTGASLSITGN